MDVRRIVFPQGEFDRPTKHQRCTKPPKARRHLGETTKTRSQGVKHKPEALTRSSEGNQAPATVPDLRQQASVQKPGQRGAVKRSCSSCVSTSAVTCAGAVSSVCDLRSQMQHHQYSCFSCTKMQCYSSLWHSSPRKVSTTISTAKCVPVLV